MKFIKYIFLFFAFPLCVSAQENLPDSLIDEEAVDSSLITRRNVATNFNYLDHILEGRYLAKGDEFTKKWNDHLFLEAGMGMEQVVAPSSSYSLTPFTTVTLALGKQFNPKHSVRLSLRGGYAYQKRQEFFMYQLGAKLDHIFDMSSYFAGYDPTRRLSVSTIAGVGAMRSQFMLNSSRSKDSGIAVEGHLGLQFKIFTGPQGYINIEPYAGISSDPIDISDKKNWRTYDGFYGANINYVYYLRNNLSPEARAEYMVKRVLKDELTSDSTLFSWRKPLFVEMANSTHILNVPELPAMQTLGLGYTLGLGAWLSPAIALRGSVASENVVFTHTTNPLVFSYQGFANNQELTDVQAGNYLGLRAEALFNPFGLVRHYDWNTPFGVYAIAGLQVGKLWKRNYSQNDLAAYYQGYTAGLHFWTRLSDGLQVFIEPRFEHNEYHKPLKGKPANWRYHDNLWGVNIGMTVSTRTRKYTDWKLWEERDQSQFMHKFVIGAGGGINYLQKRTQNIDKNLKLGLNIYGYFEYHLNALHSVRVVADGVYHPLYYYTKSLERPYAKRRYANAFLSFDYMVNVTNLLNSQDPDLRTFEAFAFVGPSIVSGIDKKQITKPQPTVNFGAKLLYHVNRHIGIHLTPSFYYVPSWIKENFYKDQRISAMTFIETLNAGVQYTF